MKRNLYLAGERWGTVFYLAILAASLIVEAIEEGSSLWTIFKALASLAVLLLTTALLSARPATTSRLRVASWIILASLPWGLDFVVERAFVFPLNAPALGIEQQQAFPFLMAGFYSLAMLILVAFLAARPLRQGLVWSWYAILATAFIILAGDLLASSLIYYRVLNLLEHLLLPAFMLMGLAVAWPALGTLRSPVKRVKKQDLVPRPLPPPPEPDSPSEAGTPQCDVKPTN